MFKYKLQSQDTNSLHNHVFEISIIFIIFA